MIVDQEFISNLEGIIEANYQRNDFGVDQLAKELHISRSQLHRKISKALGISAGAYINEFRLKEARLLLQEGSMASFEVAYAVGFSSPSYFSTSFKKFYGYSPAQVRIQGPISENTYAREEDDVKMEFRDREGSIQSLVSNISPRNRLFIICLAGFAIASFFLLQGSGLGADQLDPTLSSNKSIAVLPFRNYSNDPSLNAFCDGMADELISKLSKIDNFDRVISRTSSFKYKDEHWSVPEIAADLGVSYILEGNLQKADGKIRVNLQLIDTKIDDHVWTDHCDADWESEDIFDIQEKITAFVANAMEVTLTQDDLEQSRTKVTANKQAYHLYLQAKFYMHSADEESMENAQQMLDKAIALDSTFATAYSELGFIWSVSGFAEGIKKQVVAWNKAKYYLDKAQQLNPSLVNNELYLLQGYFYYDWDFTRLEEFYRTRFSKLTYDRNSAGLIDYALKTGRYESALAVINKSIEVDPLDAGLFSFKARALWFLGRKEEAVSILEEMDKLNKNDWFYLREAAHNYFLMKEYEHSRRALDIVIEGFKDRSPILIWLKLFYAHLDKKSEAVKAGFDELYMTYTNGNSGSPAWFIALYYIAINNDREKAFEWLEKSYESKEVEMTWLQQEPLLQPLKNDDRYWSLHRRMGFDLVRSK